jgi:hypothetical protein
MGGFSTSSLPRPFIPRTHPLAWLLNAPRALAHDDRERHRHLNTLQGPGELHAAVLALLLTPGSRLEMGAWATETRDITVAARVLEDVQSLSRAEALPWLETLLERLAKMPTAQRQALLEAARRLMAADGHVRTQDRLRWLLLRHRLAGSTPLPPPTAARHDLSLLDAAQVGAIATFSAFLSLLVPLPEMDVPIDPDGERWYAAVMAHWFGPVRPPARERPDGDATARALRIVQSLPWMQRPVLARLWHDAAMETAESPMLHPEAADALRASCMLLDSPLPPLLARQYIEPDGRRAS